MPYAVRGQGKAAAWCGRLLLFAALIVGIVGMHTLGHPGGGHGSPGPVPGAQHQGHEVRQHASAPAPITSPALAPPAHTSPALASPALAPDGAVSVVDDHHAMDPGAVCLAVLSLCVLALVRTGRLLDRQAADLLAAVRARLLRGLRPLPPPVPRHKHLARLSVLRV
ncbi:hypothetical protein [Streptomyces sp. CB02923]|uniref:hypothetical protein n=1 Tax=Streptomyces sp. CB02923 TaxID=1718985 RepID=UPI0018FFAC3D|nr:hypothetical protein [Streptomyces sp. CB02923]